MDNHEINSPQVNRLIPITKWEDYHPWPSKHGLRYLVFNAEKNGFHVVIRRVGGRILISEKDFLLWAEAQNQITSKNSI